MEEARNLDGLKISYRESRHQAAVRVNVLDREGEGGDGGERGRGSSALATNKLGPALISAGMPELGVAIETPSLLIGE